MNTHLQEIQSIIDNKIGPAAALGFKVQHYDGQQLSLSAPLSQNLNHHGTAFGGSLFSLAAVCGWGFVLLKMREHALHGLIVVKQSSVEYLAPVQNDLSVSCGADEASVAEFIQTFKSKGRARLEVRGVAPSGPREAALTLRSTYTAIAQPPESPHAD